MSRHSSGTLSSQKDISHTATLGSPLLFAVIVKAAVRFAHHLIKNIHWVPSAVVHWAAKF
jgi:hypothetical protein